MDKIQWFKFENETFQLAKEQNKPIFLYVTHSTCKLCKKMEEEILCNSEITKRLNQNFIPIKINKQDRPDVARYYQKLYYMLNKHQVTYPVSVFATPQNKPFFAGAYIALESDKHSIEGMGFLELTHLISSKVKNNDQTLQQNAIEVEEFMSKSKHPTQATVLKENFKETLLAQARQNYDTKHKGFGSTPKFLHTELLNSLFELNALKKDNSAQAMVKDTLTAMQNSSIFDKNSGGFFRYANKRTWDDTSKEKRLTDNARLIQLYIKAYTKYNTTSFLKTAKQSIDFAMQTLQNKNFFSSACDEKNIDDSFCISHNAIFAITLLLVSKYNIIDIKIPLKLIEYLDKQTYNFLDEHIFMSIAMFKAYELTKDNSFLTKGINLANIAVAKFYENGALYFSNNQFKTLAKNDEIGYFLEMLFLSFTHTNEQKYKHFMFKILQYNSYKLAREPLYYPYTVFWMIKYLNL